MKNSIDRSRLLLAASLAALCTAPPAAAQVSDLARVVHVELREEGTHALYLDRPLPPAGCGLDDRAILVPGGAGSAAMLQASLDALRWGSTVRVRVDGCTPIRTDSPLTAPRITKIDVF
jgi:hypothetical protein